MQISDATKSVAQLRNYEIKQKQSKFERKAKKTLGFEHFLPKIRKAKKSSLK